jgi:hypothetical protein
MTDDEKHAWCKERTGHCAGFVSPSLYAAAEKAGYDMRWFVISKPMPDETVGAEHVKSPEAVAEAQAEFKRIVDAGLYSFVAYDYHGTPFARGSVQKLPDETMKVLVPGEFTLDGGETWEKGADFLARINQPKCDRKDCSYGRACMPGHGGKCTACAMDEK